MDVWDGPYRMNCGLTLRDGRCITHGDSTMRRWRAARQPQPEPSAAPTPGEVFRDTLIRRRAARGLPVDRRPWGTLPEADRADLEAAALDAIAVGAPHWTKRLGPVVACDHEDAPVYLAAIATLSAGLRDIRDANPEAPAGAYARDRAILALGTASQTHPAARLAARIGALEGNLDDAHATITDCRAALAAMQAERDHLRELLNEAQIADVPLGDDR